MRSVVTCPGCQRRLGLNIGVQGKRIRCPACSTPFVLGARTNEGAEGDAEFLAFEIFDELVVSEGLEIIAAAPAHIPAPKPPPPKPKKRARAAASNRLLELFEVVTDAATAATKDDGENMRVDVDFSLERIRKSDEILPDVIPFNEDFDPNTTHTPTEPPAPPTANREPEPEKRSEPEPPPPVVDHRSDVMPKPAPVPVVSRAAPSTVRQSKPKPPPGIPSGPAGHDTDLELPDDFLDSLESLEATPQPAMPPSRKPAPKPVKVEQRSSLPASSPSSYGIRQKPVVAEKLEVITWQPATSAPAQRFEAEFEIIATPSSAPVIRQPAIVENGFTVVNRPASTARSSAGGVPILDSATEDEVAEFESSSVSAPEEQYDECYDDDYVDRRGYRPTRQRKPTRGEWLMAFWGVTCVLAGLGLDVLAIVLMIVSVLFGWLGLQVGALEGLAGAGLFVIIAFGLLSLQQVITFVGYGFCLGAPAKGSARMWAILTMAMAVAGIALTSLHFFAQESWLSIGIYPGTALIELLKWVFFLLFLVAIGRALRNNSIEEEVFNTLKLTAMVIVLDVFVFLGGMLIGWVVVGSAVYSGGGLTGIRAGIIIGVLTWVILIGSIVLLLIRNITCLQHVREAIRDRIER